MIWVILISAIVLIIIFRFFNDRNKDNNDLRNITAPEKFSIIVDRLNQYAYGGCGDVTILNNRQFYMLREHSNQIIIFMYSTGHLSVDWKYIYYQQEVVYSRQFSDVRNITDDQQEIVASIIIEEVSRKIEQHKNSFWTK